MQEGAPDIIDMSMHTDQEVIAESKGRRSPGAVILLYLNLILSYLLNGKGKLKWV